MAIYCLFRNKPFEPEAISVLTGAYADVCRALGLADGDRRRDQCRRQEGDRVPSVVSATAWICARRCCRT